MRVREMQIDADVFYIVARDFESYEQGRIVRDRFDCPWVPVENALLGQPRQEVYHHSRDYAALDWHPLRTRMPPLDPFLAEVIGDPRLSLSGPMREQMQRLPLDISLE